MLKQRIITALILFLAFLAALFLLPSTGWMVLMLGVVMLGLWDWSRLIKLSGAAAPVYWWGSLFGLAGLFAWATWTGAEPLVYFVASAASAVFWLLLAPFWLLRGWQPQNRWFMALVGWLVLAPFGVAMIGLRDFAPGGLLLLMMLVWVADTAAYFAGRAFGKHKLAPVISPGKTWEGVLGALLGVALYVLVVVWLWSQTTVDELELAPVMPSAQEWLMLIALAWFGVALAVIGDLFESAIKRQAGVKDSGTLLPGHGGLLDRIDALTSTLPLAMLGLMVIVMISGPRLD
jgi:phosphatidate cytidylyltransferase